MAAIGGGYRGTVWHVSFFLVSKLGYLYGTRKEEIPFAEMKLPVYTGTVRIMGEPVLSAANRSLFKFFQSVCLDVKGYAKATGTPDLERSPAEIRREFEQPR